MITYKQELITPQRAKQLLASNAENNRRPRDTRIRQYARDMAAGNWNSNTAEFIKIDIKGNVIDGQNRLLAVILSGTPVYFGMAYDVPTEAMQVIDTGATRSAADALKIAGATERTLNASAVRWAIMWDARLFTGAGGSTGLHPSITEINERYLKEQDAFDAAATRGADCRRRGLGTGAPAAVAHYLFGRIDAEQCHQFYDQYISGAELQVGSPVLALRNRIARLRVDRATRAEQLALFIRAWNAFRAGATLDRMMIVRAGELNNVNFPQPK